MKFTLFLFFLFSVARAADTPAPVTASDIDPRKCQWFSEIPRRVVTTPSSCSPRYPVKTCSGYAECEVGQGKFLISVVCDDSFCEGNQIQECIADESHGVQRYSEASDVSDTIFTDGVGATVRSNP